MVTVIIPTYNREHLVLDALDSVRAQDFRPVEIVVVDDGSTDNTVGLVEAWAQQYAGPDLGVRLVSQPNLGGNAARNAGIRAASGEFVAFLDSDDTWSPGKLSKQVGYLEANPGCGAVYCGLEEVDAASGIVLGAPVSSFPQGTLFPEILVRDITAPTSCYMLRRRVFEVAGYFDEALEARQDWDMWIRVAQQFPIGAVAENLVQLRHHAGARTASDPMREIRALGQLREKYRDVLEAQPCSVQMRARSACHRRLGRVYFHRGLSRTRALGHYLSACLYDPLAFDNYAALCGFFLPRRLRRSLHIAWNKRFGRGFLAIRSH